RLAASCLNSGEKERRFLVIRHLVYGGDITTYVGVRNHWTTTSHSFCAFQGTIFNFSSSEGAKRERHDLPVKCSGVGVGASAR
ncbi:hypothetical protein, partial [Marinobacter sp. BGYM27]|uniref:hypothetical protein n=1 Tax=Marinobacter sp. BGYM27 TaxID=2975597 RepID=UPI0021A8F5EF